MHPRYLDPNCPECGEPLVLSDLLDDPDMNPDDVWNDEWACPKCYDGDGVWIDFEPEDKEELDNRLKEVESGTMKTIPWEVVKKEMWEKLGLTEEEIKEREEEIKKESKKMIEENDFPKSRRILNFG